jgi:Bacterial Ig-like domain (group 2)
MRAQYPFTALLSAAALLAACETNTGPDLPPDESEPMVMNVAPSFATIEGQRFIKLTAILSGSTAEAPQELVTWSSSDTNVATVGRGGLVEGRKAGRALITASWRSASGSATVVVQNPIIMKPVSPPCLANGTKPALRTPDGGGKC